MSDFKGLASEQGCRWIFYLGSPRHDTLAWGWGSRGILKRGRRKKPLLSEYPQKLLASFSGQWLKYIIENMRVIVKYFGIFQECAGKKEMKMTLAESCTAQELYNTILSDFPERRKLPKVLFAVNQEFVKPSYSLKDGDEFALIPPMSGG